MMDPSHLELHISLEMVTKEIFHHQKPKILSQKLVMTTGPLLRSLNSYSVAEVT